MAKLSFTVLVPAHNEERTIGSLLSTLAPQPGLPDAEVIILCNACRDATADTARQIAPWARVVEIDQPGKAYAINIGLGLTRTFPVLVVDADIRVSHAALAAVAEALADGSCQIAAPQLVVDIARSSWPVAAYYRVWLTQPYVAEDLVGSGVYGLSQQAAAIVGTLPPVIADDAYVRTRFAREDRKSVSVCRDGTPTQFVVTAPANLASLLRIEARRRAGDAQIRRHFAGRLPRRDTTLRSLATQQGMTRPGIADRLAYAAIKLAGRALYLWNRLARRDHMWFRDESSRG